MKPFREGMKVSEVMDIIESALTATGDERKEIVEFLLASGPHARENIGYLSGYFPPEKAAAVLELFQTEHPIFGKVRPTPEEAFALGKAGGGEKLLEEYPSKLWPDGPGGGPYLDHERKAQRAHAQAAREQRVRLKLPPYRYEYGPFFRDPRD